MEQATTPAAAGDAKKPPMLDKIMRRLIWGAVLGVLVFAGFSLYADVDKLIDNLARYGWLYAPLAVALVCVNYGIRFARWHYYLRIAEIDAPLRSSASIFFSGFVMSVTPGKFGEVLKSL